MATTSPERSQPVVLQTTEPAGLDAEPRTARRDASQFVTHVMIVSDAS